MRLNNTGDEKSRSLVGLTISASKRLLTLVDEMLNYSNEPALLLSDQRCLQLNKLLKNVVELIDVPHSVKVNFPKVEHTLTCSSVALEQIFLNLLTNAVRYNDKQEGLVTIQFREEGNYYKFKITDNGMGIAENNLQKIFEKSVTLNALDRLTKKGMAWACIP
jgi:signal transduction histidine kinase